MDFSSDEFDQICRKDFSDYDKDGSGFIEVGELAASLVELSNGLEQMAPGSGFEVSEDLVSETLQDFDYNGDGKLSYEEFKDFAVRVYTKIIETAKEAEAAQVADAEAALAE